MQRLAFLAALLLSMHSVVDYPLRTTALEAVFALLIAMIAPSRGLAARRAERSVMKNT